MKQPHSLHSLLNFTLDTITPLQFKDYCDGPFRRVLDHLSLPLGKGRLKLKEAAALSLGAASYEALKNGWDRKERITQRVHIEIDPNHNDCLALKSKNILFLFDPSKSTFMGIALEPGQESRPFFALYRDLKQGALKSNAKFRSIKLPQGAILLGGEALKTFNLSIDDSTERTLIGEGDDPQFGVSKAKLYYMMPDRDDHEKGVIHVRRTHTDVTITVMDSDEPDRIFDQGKLKFAGRHDTLNTYCDSVDLVSSGAFIGQEFGTSYQWASVDVNSNGDYTVEPPQKHTKLHQEYATELLAVDAAQYAQEYVTQSGLVLVRCERSLVRMHF